MNDPIPPNAKKSTEIGSWESVETQVVPFIGTVFQEWELMMLKAVRPEHVIIDGEAGQFAASGLYDPFKAIGSAFIDLPPLPLNGESAAKAAVPPPTSAPSRPTIHKAPVPMPHASCSTPTVSLVKPSRLIQKSDYYDGIREYLHNTLVLKLDLNKLSKDQREGLKRGLPHDQQEDKGEEFFAATSDAQRRKFASFLPVKPTSLPDLIATWLESLGWMRCPQDGTWFVSSI